jgi:hypothetical protein
MYGIGANIKVVTQGQEIYDRQIKRSTNKFLTKIFFPLMQRSRRTELYKGSSNCLFHTM